MARFNELLKSKLIFEKTENACAFENESTSTRVVISTTYDGIYKQYSYIYCPTQKIHQDPTQLDEEAKKFLTHSIDMELSKKYVRCKSCWQHIMKHFEKSCTYKCGNCGDINEIKVLIEKP